MWNNCEKVSFCLNLRDFQFSNGRVYRTDDYQDDPYNFEYEKYRPPTADYEYIEGSQYLQSPFIIYHNDGVVSIL